MAWSTMLLLQSYHAFWKIGVPRQKTVHPWNWLMWAHRKLSQYTLQCWKLTYAIENYHHQYYADMCSAILTCTSFSDNIILPGLKGQPHCVATKRVFNIAETHGFSIVSCHENSVNSSWGRKPLLTSHLPRKHGSMESGSLTITRFRFPQCQQLIVRL